MEGTERRCECGGEAGVDEGGDAGVGAVAASSFGEGAPGVSEASGAEAALSAAAASEAAASEAAAGGAAGAAGVSTDVLGPEEAEGSLEGPSQVVSRRAMIARTTTSRPMSFFMDSGGRGGEGGGEQASAVAGSGEV
jgi:hypothetical protein